MNDNVIKIKELLKLKPKRIMCLDIVDSESIIVELLNKTSNSIEKALLLKNDNNLKEKLESLFKQFEIEYTEIKGAPRYFHNLTEIPLKFFGKKTIIRNETVRYDGTPFEYNKEVYVRN